MEDQLSNPKCCKSTNGPTNSESPSDRVYLGGEEIFDTMLANLVCTMEGKIREM